ncbi:MAG: hypothetical protein II534_08165 [Clostridia bacterium]|nr:hypothetical protein [Clostridia bacterium]
MGLFSRKNSKKEKRLPETSLPGHNEPASSPAFSGDDALPGNPSPRSPAYRYIIIAVAFLCVAAVYVFSMVRLYATRNDGPDVKEENYRTRNVTLQAVRGEIFDREGRPLVTNEYVYSLIFDYSQLATLSLQEQNDVIARVMDYIDAEGIRDLMHESYCPLSGTYPYYNYDLGMLSGSLASSRFARIRSDMGLPDDVDAVTFGEALAVRFRMLGSDGEPLYPDARMTDLVAVRYEMEAIRFSAEEPYYLLSGIGIREITGIRELGARGTGIRVSYSRVYHYPGTASHILGRISKIYAENAEYYTSLGYPVTAVVGVDGCELAFENYLRGMDGTMKITEDADGNIISAEVTKQPEPGLDVYLTLDIELQKAAEKALEDNIAYVRDEAGRTEGKLDGEDCNSGAMVVERIGTGEVLAIASYPTYDLSTFGSDYSSLLADKRTPLFNRALEGTYAPGSTFKVGVAAGALTDGTLMSDGRAFNPATVIVTEGKYTYYDDYQPECWLYAYGHQKHGAINVTKAIEVSCNCFFYELGRLMGIDNINKYCRAYGLGQPTGIEVHESTGVLADSDYTRQLGVVWTGGVTIQTAIGQGYNRFTPMQLANYTATIIGGGKRYSVHLLHEVKDFGGSTVFSAEPEIAAEFSMTGQTLETIRNAMSRVVEENASVTAFDKFPVKVGGKTGTAQVTGQSSNAVFIAFAPLDRPEIAVSCVLERGAHGASAALGVRAVMEKYFGIDPQG